MFRFCRQCSVGMRRRLRDSGYQAKAAAERLVKVINLLRQEIVCDEMWRFEISWDRTTLLALGCKSSKELDGTACGAFEDGFRKEERAVDEMEMFQMAIVTVL
eukprot:185548-Hanusia_phi.AAC.1